MLIKIQSIHFNADKKLIAFINKKVGKLEKFNDKITKAEVFLKLEQEGTNIKNKVAEVKVHIPGKILFAKEHAKTFEVSIGMVSDSLGRQLKKYKQKSKS